MPVPDEYVRDENIVVNGKSDTNCSVEYSTDHCPKAQLLESTRVHHPDFGPMRMSVSGLSIHRSSNAFSIVSVKIVLQMQTLRIYVVHFEGF